MGIRAWRVGEQRNVSSKQGLRKVVGNGEEAEDASRKRRLSAVDEITERFRAELVKRYVDGARDEGQDSWQLDDVERIVCDVSDAISPRSAKELTAAEVELIEREESR